jgi:hypothetical protein
MIPGVILIVVGAAIAAVAVVVKTRAKRQFGWDRVEGKITSSRHRLWGDAYWPEIEYTYAHKGRTFRGTRLRTLQITINVPMPAQRDAARYPAGASVTVYVNPHYSNDAVLEPGGHSWFVPFMVLFGSVPMAIGVAIIA